MKGYRNQPWKTLFLGYQAITLVFFRLPFWFLISLPPQLRPRRAWSLSRSLWVRFVSFIGNTEIAVGGFSKQHDYRAIDGSDGVWIDPAPASAIVGEIAELAKVNNLVPVRLPGYWQAKPGGTSIRIDAPAEPGERVILYLHGGAYILFSAHPEDFEWSSIRGILEHTHTVRRAFAPEYRLSAGAPYAPATVGAFPTALIDALAGYLHLLRRGFEPEHVIVVGNSAGGNLALALVRYLLENKDALAHAAANGLSLRAPGSLILSSPWGDLGTSHDVPLPPYLSQTDFIARADFLREKYAQRAFVGALGLGAANTHRYISPASSYIDEVSFQGFPRTFISFGGQETFAESIRTLHKRMGASMGAEEMDWLACYEAPEAIHDHIVFEWQEPERTETLEMIAQWIENQ